MNKTLEREIAAFVESLKHHLARLIEEANKHFIRRVLDQEEVELVIQLSIADLWTRRYEFDPTKTDLHRFFGQIVEHSLNELPSWNEFRGRTVQYTEEERAVLDALFKPEEEFKPVQDVFVGEKVHQPMDAPEKVGKECPPCYRCRWFYGWLPKRSVKASTHSDPEIAVACDNLNKNKVRIAHWVRGDPNWDERELELE